MFWHRSGVFLQFDNGLAGSNFVDNLYTWRGEERISVSVSLPTSICVVTGLPES